MSPLERLTSGLGLTRGDLRVALFLAATALAGFVYLHFFENRADFRRRVGMARLLAVADSISAATEMAGLSGLYDGATPEWRPLSAEEMLDEGTDGEGRGELTLEDVAPIDLNGAPAEILELLPGVGEKTALKIIAARPFSSVEDLLRVHGIGAKKLEKMRAYIVVRRGTADPDESPDTTRKAGATIDSTVDPVPPDSIRIVDSTQQSPESQKKQSTTTVP